MASYFPSSYFPASYFSPVSPFDATSEPGDPDVVMRIIESIDALSCFGSVHLFGPSAGDSDALVAPQAVVVPLRWTECVDPAQGRRLRLLDLEVVLAVSHDDVASGYSALENLVRGVRSAVEGKDLGGLVLPSLSGFDRGEWEARPSRRTYRATLHGRFAYAVNAPRP
jgi:hypothetical protein